MNTKDNKKQLDNDFSRNLWNVLGLPFDAINIQQTSDEIIAAITEKRRCFLSTPNLNFLCAAQSDDDFRQSVINSELSIADGFPIILIVKLLNIPLPERVAGSDLIDYLFTHKKDKPLKVFFFGGEDGVGEIACQKINQANKGLHVVGHYCPGFGSVDDMSTPEIIDNINQHEIDFLIVSLGAKKGQAWIEKNKSKLNAHAISHLGAVINFFAGTVKRAPIGVQRCNLEWLWRIYQEPKLWRRYFDDGTMFLKLFCFNVLPYWWWLKSNKARLNNNEDSCEIKIEKSSITTAFLSGSCCDKTIKPLRSELKQLVLGKKNVVIDLSKVTFIDGAFIGLLFIFSKHLSISANTLTLANANSTIQRLLKWNKADYLLKR